MSRILVALAAAAVTFASSAAPCPAAYTERQAEQLGMRAAQADALRRLTERILTARMPDGRTVDDALDPGGGEGIALRVALRTARVVGLPRTYSDGITEVDIEIALADVRREVARLVGGDADAPAFLADLADQAVGGVLRATGAGRPPEDVPPEVLRKVMKARREAFPEVFPLGWQSVDPSGRLQAARDARIRAYQDIASRVMAVSLSPAKTLGEELDGARAAEIRLDTFLRSLPVRGRPRFMPDRIAEIEVAAPVADLIETLKDLRPLLPAERRWPDAALDQVSVRLKTDELVVVGRGMPAADFVREGPVEERPASAPDWVDRILEARGEAGIPDDVEDGERARVLAARAAESEALKALARKVNALELPGGDTVGKRAADDEAFAKDRETFLRSARITQSRALDGDRWEVTLRLPLERLYELSR